MRDKDYKRITNFRGKIDKILTRFKSLRRNRLRRNKDLSMTIYIHGGLNEFEKTVERAKNTYEKILFEGQYPVFICWEAGFFTNYGDYLTALRNGERKLSEPSEPLELFTMQNDERKPSEPLESPEPLESLKDSLGAIISTPFVFAEDVLRSAVRIPASNWDMLTKQNQVAIKLFGEEKLMDGIEERIEQEQEFKVYNKGSSTGHGFWDFSTIWNPVKLITAPLADGFGKGAWRSLLRRTDLVLNSQAGFEGKGRKDSETALHYFLSKLEKLDRERKYPPVKKVLIWHSMGTIIANNILSRFPDIDFDTVVYMAAACKLKDLEKSVVPWLRRNENGEFYNLTLDPYRDINENGWFDFIPRGSLLVWIDGFLEDVNSFEDRTAGYWFNIVRGADIIFPPDKDLRSRVHLTKFGIDLEEKSVPQTHGAFDDYNFWCKSFWENNEEDIISIIDPEGESVPHTCDAFDDYDFILNP